MSPRPPAAPTAGQAGYQRLLTRNGMDVAIWYPAAGVPERRPLGLLREQDVVPSAPPPPAPPLGSLHPLVVISHGTGGSLNDHVDVALVLARAGFVVAALNHAGDTGADHAARTRIEARAPALSALITYMLTAWPDHAALDPARIGAFGFSAGGFTVLVAAGGRPDLSRLAPQCQRHPARYDCAIAAAHPATTRVPWPDQRDARIRAAVVAAPGLGYLFDRSGLAAVTIPIQLWRADRDRVVSGPWSVDVVRAELPTAPEFHPVPGAGHLDFMAPCANPAILSRKCLPTPGFDAIAFHRGFDAAVLGFFRTNLGGVPTEPPVLRAST